MTALSLLLASVALGPGGDAGAFIPLGDLPGGATYSQAYNVSTDGSAVVGYATSATGGVPFRWTEATGMVALETPEVGAFGWGVGVACGGTLFVGSATTPNGFEVVAWTPVTGLVVLGDPAGGPVNATAADLSADGRYLVGHAETTPGAYELFRWSVETGFVGLGYLPGGEAAAFANAGGCSDDGSIVVGATSSTGGNEACLWIDGVGMIGLGDLPGGTFTSQAWSMSSDGSVVVGFGDAADGFEAFRWEDGVMASLGDLPGPPHGSQANDVSADGSVVVGFANGSFGDGDAFIWTEAEGMRKLQDVLADEHGLAAELSGWRLQGVSATTPDGRTFVGWGLNPAGETEAFLARMKPFAPGDLNRDGVVDILDLLGLLAGWG